MPRSISVRNPRTGENDYRFQAPAPAELDAECQRLRSAQPAWAEAPISHRMDVMSRWADASRAARRAGVEGRWFTMNPPVFLDQKPPAAIMWLA